MRIGIQGAAGSFHHIAAEHWFGGDNTQKAQEHDYYYGETFEDVFKALENKEIASAVVAIENSRYGSISEVYDLLLRYNFPIVGEVAEQIHQQLIALPGSKIADIRQVFSHPVALGQTSHFLDNILKNTEKIEYYDTAAAVEHIKVLGNKQNAAIAGHLAAEIHDMAIIAPNIEDEKQNYTRFLIIQRSAARIKDANKASLVLQTEHKAGSLYRAMGIFAKRNLNLTKLQSRPIGGKVWKYHFYVDVEVTGDILGESVDELTKDGCKVTVLGQYLADPRTFED
jgi:prephenate dehydratase